MEIQQNEETIGFNAAFRAKAAAAIGEFERALEDIVGKATLAERNRLRDSANGLMRLAAGVMIRTG